MPAESALGLPRRQHRTSFSRAAVREAGYEFDTSSIHWLVSGMRRIERRNCYHTKPDNAAFAMVIAATIQSCTRRAHPDDHRPATMKVDTDILSIHRGLLLFVRGLVVRNPESGPTRILTRSGGPAPSSHQF
jgi:hypothetical protein